MARKKLEDKLILEAHEKGKSMVKLAEELGMSQGNIYRRAKRILPVGTFVNKKEWVKLNKVKTRQYQTSTRTICIRKEILSKAGLDPNKEYVGKWELVEKGIIRLVIREA
jgi:hypothetical protein